MHLPENPLSNDHATKSIVLRNMTFKVASSKTEAVITKKVL